MSARVLAIGTDEAGLGPWVGPFTLAGVAVEAPAALDCGRLWDALGEAVAVVPPDPRAVDAANGGAAEGAPSSGAGAQPVVVCDSKRAFVQAGGDPAALATLERTVLATTALLGARGHLGARPRSFAALLRALEGPDLADIAARAPWAGVADVALPVSSTPDGEDAGAGVFARALEGAGVRVRAVRLRLLDAADYNARLTACGENKGRLVVEETVELLRSLVAVAPGLPLRATCGRLGGRKFYGGALGALGAVLVSTVEEREHCSSYELAGAVSGRVSFRVDADADDFLVALASMVAKYAREVYMLSLNRWLGERRPGLSPTAGYGADGRRFIRQCRPVLKKAGLSLDVLARRR